VSESPAQLEARINDQRKTLEDRLQQQRIAEQQSMNLEKARSAFDQVFEELGLFSRQIQEWAEQIRGEREAQRVLRQLQIDMKAAQSDLEKVAYHGKQLETQIGQTEERTRRQQEQTTKSTQELAQSQEQLTQEHGRKQAEARLNYVESSAGYVTNETRICEERWRNLTIFKASLTGICDSWVPKWDSLATL
jgi:chromosome segregation ATPase